MRIHFLLRKLLAVFVIASAFHLAPETRAQLVNTSVRIRVGTGDDVLITGFVVGNTPKTFLFRAGGPALAGFGVPGTLLDPRIQLYSGTTLIDSNNDWSAGDRGDAIRLAAESVAAFPYVNGSKDAALIATLQPGAYTVQISGADGGTGIALFEAYELAAPAATATLRGLVRDGVDGRPLSGVTLSFTSATGVALGSATTNASGEYSIAVPPGTVIATVSAGGFVTTSLRATLSGNSTVQADSVLFARNQPGNGTVSGRVTNALTGTGLGGVTLRFRSGVGVTTGTVVGTVATDSAGNYTVSLPSGSYTCEVALGGFVTSYFSCVSVGGLTVSNQNSSITPVLSTGDLRIVLTWARDPSDLDSHLTGPIPGSQSRFHVFYSERNANGVNLDVDEMGSFGPETITISQFTPGVYRYSVHDYTNRDSTTSTALSNLSNAQVRVFEGNVQIATFNVPSGRIGNLWTVFEFDGVARTITPVNTVSNISGPSAVPSLQPDVAGTWRVSTDADLIRRAVGTEK